MLIAAVVLGGVWLLALTAIAAGLRRPRTVNVLDGWWPGRVQLIGDGPEGEWRSEFQPVEWTHSASGFSATTGMPKFDVPAGVHDLRTQIEGLPAPTSINEEPWPIPTGPYEFTLTSLDVRTPAAA